jgi:hypothetical protein
MSIRTITLISAYVGDWVGDAVELAELGRRPAWMGISDVIGFLRENNYGPHHPNELIYVALTDHVPEGFPVLQVQVSEAEFADIQRVSRRRSA